MNLYKDIVAELKKEYDSGKTYKSIAKEKGMSYSHVHDLITGDADPKNVSLETFFKLFPFATVNIHGNNNITQTASNVRVKNGSVNSISVNPGSVSTEMIRDRIISSLVSLDIPLEFRDAALRMIKEVNLKDW